MEFNLEDVLVRARERVKRAEESPRKLRRSELAKTIDHTILKPDAREEDVIRVLKEAEEQGFYGICIPPSYLPLLKRERSGEIKLITVVGFPLGYSPTDVKVKEAEWVVEHGADEVDMVLNLGMIKDGHYDRIREEVERVKRVTPLLKVILETALLTDEEKILSARATLEAGADFVKTSTGFGPGGATPWDVALLKETVGEKAQVKAAGGIRTYQDAIKLISCGASRIGASRSLQIIKDAPL